MKMPIHIGSSIRIRRSPSSLSELHGLKGPVLPTGKTVVVERHPESLTARSRPMDPKQRNGVSLEESDVYHERSPNSALDLLLGNRVVTVGIEPPHIVFGFYQVEARLFTPTTAPDGEIMTGFFCNMEAVSLNEKQGLEFVAHALTTESAALVGWQKIDVVELGNDKAPGAYRVGGRVFFDGKTFDA